MVMVGGVNHDSVPLWDTFQPEFLGISCYSTIPALLCIALEALHLWPETLVARRDRTFVVTKLRKRCGGFEGSVC